MKRLLISLLVLLAPLRAEVTEEHLQSIYPTLERSIEQGRQDWNVKAVAIGVIHQDRLVYFKGFGQKSPQDPVPPDQDTLFAIGSTTKAYAAATLAIGVDEGWYDWDTRVMDLHPTFRMWDPWVTREFRVADLLAQHSGMAPYVLTTYGTLGYSPDRVIAAMAHMKPVSSFRSQFAYVNVPHMVAGEMLAKLSREPDWEAFLKKRLLDPLGMRRTSWTPQAFNSEPNRAVGYVAIGEQSLPRPASTFPYVFGPAGALNSCVLDVSHWVRMQLADGKFDGKQLVSKTNLDMTRTPQTTLSQTAYYCMGWLYVAREPQAIIWHNGGTPGHRSFVGLMPSENLGVVVLTNNGDADLSDAVGFQFFDLATGVKGPDYSAVALERHKKSNAEALSSFTRPKDGAPPGSGAEYAGTYRSEILGDVVVSEQLTFKLVDTGLEGRLTPYDGDIFVARSSSQWAIDNGADYIGKWTFMRDTDGSGFNTLRCVLGLETEGAITLATRKK